jgi:precorrin-6A synthase
MRRLLIIGIGAGHPEQLTVQAVRALNEVDVFFVLDKGDTKNDLAQLRRDICARYIERPGYRMVEVQDPVRDPALESYTSRVEAWHHERAVLFERLIARELGESDCGAILVWGDPALYDSTLRIVERVLERNHVAFTYQVVPGVSSVQGLAAGHKIALNKIGGAVHITTGRKLAEAATLRCLTEQDNLVVMLDGACSFQQLAPEVRAELEIFWGAYVGSEHELLIAGKLTEVAGEILRVRAEARARHGWIMDVYLLRKLAAAPAASAQTTEVP